MQENLKVKQDNLYWEFNTDTQLVDIMWILETEDGRFYQKTKSINLYPKPKIRQEAKEKDKR